jgi:hypothetical protein
VDSVLRVFGAAVGFDVDFAVGHEGFFVTGDRCAVGFIAVAGAFRAGVLHGLTPFGDMG